MFNVIKDYCTKNSQPTGLFLLDMPTGTGKTYEVLNFIYHYATTSGKKTIFFITPLIKNLPVTDLKKIFEENNKLDIFNEKCLILESNTDSIINNLDKVLDKINNEIKNTDEFKTLDSAVDFYKYSLNNKSISTKKYQHELLENIRIKLEPNFRKKLSSILDNHFKNKKQKLDAIMNNEEWSWISILYPAVLTSKKKIIFMSIDKFLLRNDTIIEPSYLFYESKVIDDSIIFIDEFDSTKTTILNRLIDNGLDERINTIDLFLDIYQSLNVQNLPAVLTTEAKSHNNNYSLDTIINNFKNIANEIYNKYHMDYRFKTHIDVTNDESFLFHDHGFHTITDKSIRFKSDDLSKYNYIDIDKYSDNEENNNINQLLGSLRGYLSYFKQGIQYLAQNYMNLKNENINGHNEELFTFEDAVRSVLHEICANDKYIEYLTNNILFEHNKKNNTYSPNYDLSFYEKGFQYYDFKDDQTHDMHSQIMMTSFNTTPEKILLNICDKAKVIGISATATLPCVTYNYDIDYIKSRLGEKYHTLSSVEEKRLTNHFERATSHYDKVDIKVRKIDSGDEENYGIELWNKIFRNKEYAEQIYYLIENIQFNKKTYIKQRYYRIAKAFSKFVKSKTIKSFLCLLNLNAKNNDDELDKNIIEQIFKIINEDHNNSKTINNYEFLYSENFEYNKDNILQRLSCGEKIFIISSYQSIGAGQNLQYKIPNEIKDDLVKINDFEARSEKDIDAIYLDCPTHIFMYLYKNINEEDFCKYIFQIEYLMQIGEISEIDARNRIRNAYYVKCGNNSEKLKTLKNTDTYKFACARIIIQAIGRICRTNMKNKEIYIFYDKQIRKYLNPNQLNKRLVNNEMQALLNAVKKDDSDSNNILSYKNVANINNTRSRNYILHLLDANWTLNKIDDWKKLRDLTLKFPTVDINDIEQINNLYNVNGFDIIQNFYIKMPNLANAIYYNQENDFGRCEISFCKTDEYPYTVSAENARLDKLLQLENIPTIFERNKYAKTFKKASYILSPVMYNNIYKGALGELIGFEILSSLFGPRFEEISDINTFELFDFKVKNQPIFIDMKHWTENTKQNNNDTLLKITNKLDSCNGKVALIINLLSEHYLEPVIDHYEDKIIVQIPCLYNEQDLTLNNKAIDELRKYLL